MFELRGLLDIKTPYHQDHIFIPDFFQDQNFAPTLNNIRRIWYKFYSNCPSHQHCVETLRKNGQKERCVEHPQYSRKKHRKVLNHLLYFIQHLTNTLRKSS